MNVVQLETDPHVAVQSLLPWYATNRLDAPDRARVDAHLAGCPGCRGELELERRLWMAQAEPGLAGDIDRAWTEMRNRIAAQGRPRAAPTWGRWLIGAQLALIVLLATLLVVPQPAPEPYRALGAPSPATGANAVVMFRPEASELQIRSALRDADARLVGGPTATDAYLLSVPARGHARALARLRGHAAVTLAESLDSGAAP